MEKLNQIVELVLAVLGTVSVVCALLAKLLPPGKLRDIARDLGFRAGDAIGVLKPGPKSEPKVQVKP